MKQNKVKIEVLPFGNVYSPTIKDRYFSSWKLECVGTGRKRDLVREAYLRSILLDKITPRA